MLGVDENIIYTEVRKLKSKSNEDQEIREKREAAQELAKPKVQPTEKLGNPCEIKEKALLRVLLRYFNHVIFKIEDEETKKEREIKVGEYILAELEADQLTSADPVIQKIIEEFMIHQHEEFFNPERYFVQHEDGNISKKVSGLLVDKHTESNIWRRKGAYVEDEHEILYLLVPRLIEEYKLRRVKLMINGMMKQIGELKSADDMDRIIQLQTIISNLNKVEKELSKKLGKRAITS